MFVELIRAIKNRLHLLENKNYDSNYEKRLADNVTIESRFSTMWIFSESLVLSI